MSTSNSSWHKPHWKGASQWIQAITTMWVLALLYASRNMFGGEVTHSSAPNTPPLEFEQKQYWNQEFQYGFRGENNDKYQNKTWSGADIVAVDPEDGVVFEDAKVRVSYYLSHTIDEIEALHSSAVPRAYTRLSRGIAVVEGDLDSPSAKTIIATLHAR